MARPSGDPSDLIRRLEAKLKIAHGRDVADAREMSQIIGMTWRNFLLTHIEPDAKFPVQKRGTEGIAWQFRVRTVLRHMIKRARERINADMARARRVQKLTNVSVPDDETDAVSIAELGKLAELTIKAQAAKERQKLFVPARTVADFLGGYNSAVRDAILGISSDLDSTGDMDPAVRALLDNSLRSVAVHVEQRALAFIQEWNAGTQPPGTH